LISQKNRDGTDEKVLQQARLYPELRRNNMEFFWMILIGMIAGWLAGQFMTGKGFGVIGDIIVGVIGALDRWTPISKDGSLCPVAA
jgi:F0F1-type ATP synthase assembly protein I